MSSSSRRRPRLLVASTVLALIWSSGTLRAQAPAAQPAKAVAVKEDTPGLLKKAKVSADAASATARAAVPGGVITSAEIEMEDGALIYSFDLKVAGKKGTEEVHVDAATGKVLTKEHEDAAAEKAEHAADAKAKKGKPPIDA